MLNEMEMTKYVSADLVMDIIDEAREYNPYRFVGNYKIDNSFNDGWQNAVDFIEQKFENLIED